MWTINDYLSNSILQEQVLEGSEALEREKQMNKQIMQRKQEIEWQLMEAISQVAAFQ